MMRVTSRRLISSVRSLTTSSVSYKAAETVPVVETSTIDGSAIFSSPKIEVPSFDLTRRLNKYITQSFYLIFFEKSFTVESLVAGANKGIVALAHALADRKWDQMENFVVKDLVDEFRSAKSSLQNELRFKEEDILLSFVHSSFFSGRNIIKLSESKNLCVYFTIVTYVRLSESVPQDATIRQLTGKYRKQVLKCNSTFSRVLNPLGVWKITSANFFV